MVRVVAPTPSTVPVVSCQQDLCRWTENCLSVTLQSMHGDAHSSMERFSKSMSHLSVGTSFSGVGGAENALSALFHCTKHFAPATSHPVFAWAVERNAESMAELRSMRNGPRCCFGDIQGFLQPAIKDLLVERAASMTFEQLETIFLIGKAVKDHGAWCYCHKVPPVTKQ